MESCSAAPPAHPGGWGVQAFRVSGLWASTRLPAPWMFLHLAPVSSAVYGLDPPSRTIVGTSWGGLNLTLALV
jgi:hypothetical protein